MISPDELELLEISDRDSALKEHIAILMTIVPHHFWKSTCGIECFVGAITVQSVDFVSVIRLEKDDFKLTIHETDSGTPTNPPEKLTISGPRKDDGTGISLAEFLIREFSAFFEV